MRDGETLALLALGSNLGDRWMRLRAALHGLATLPGSRLLSCSTIFETEPVGGPPQGAFLNACALLATSLDAHDLLKRVQDIEAAAKRTRSVRNGPRTLDVDLLLFGDACIHTAKLHVPHPRMLSRAFVMIPAAEIAPMMVHPETGKTLAEHAEDFRGSAGIDARPDLMPEPMS